MARPSLAATGGPAVCRYHGAVWDATDNSGQAMPTGIYIARLITPEYAKPIKMLLLK